MEHFKVRVLLILILSLTRLSHSQRTFPWVDEYPPEVVEDENLRLKDPWAWHLKHQAERDKHTTATPSMREVFMNDMAYQWLYGATRQIMTKRPPKVVRTTPPTQESRQTVGYNSGDMTLDEDKGKWPRSDQFQEFQPPPYDIHIGPDQGRPGGLGNQEGNRFPNFQNPNIPPGRHPQDHRQPQRPFPGPGGPRPGGFQQPGQFQRPPGPPGPGQWPGRGDQRPQDHFPGQGHPGHQRPGEPFRPNQPLNPQGLLIYKEGERPPQGIRQQAEELPQSLGQIGLPEPPGEPEYEEVFDENNYYFVYDPNPTPPPTLPPLEISEPLWYQKEQLQKYGLTIDPILEQWAEKPTEKPFTYELNGRQEFKAEHKRHRENLLKEYQREYQRELAMAKPIPVSSEEESSEEEEEVIFNEPNAGRGESSKREPKGVEKKRPHVSKVVATKDDEEDEDENQSARLFPIDQMILGAFILIYFIRSV